MKQSIFDYCEWNNMQIQFLLEELRANNIAPQYGFELQKTVNLNRHRNWVKWDSCNVIDLPRMEGIAVDDIHRKIILFFYSGDLLQTNALEDESRAYDFLLFDFDDILGVRLETDARRIYETTVDESILPPAPARTLKGIIKELYPNEIILTLATRRADAQVIRLHIQRAEDGSLDKYISNAMNGIFSALNKKIAVLSGTDEKSYILKRVYRDDCRDVQLQGIQDIRNMLCLFAVRIGAVVNKNMETSYHYKSIN